MRRRTQLVITERHAERRKANIEPAYAKATARQALNIDRRMTEARERGPTVFCQGYDLASTAAATALTWFAADRTVSK
jgi:hypothetical protein